MDDGPAPAGSALAGLVNFITHRLTGFGPHEDAYRGGRAPLRSVEGFIRQVIGWREFVWHLYWHLPRSYRARNELQATNSLPDWFADLDAESVDAACLSDALTGVRDHGWLHHIPRLMVLGNYAMQRGWDPAEVTDWFHRVFVDGGDSPLVVLGEFFARELEVRRRPDLTCADAA